MKILKIRPKIAENGQTSAKKVPISSSSNFVLQVMGQFYRKKTPFNHSAVLICNLDSTSGRSTDHLDNPEHLDHLDKLDHPDHPDHLENPYNPDHLDNLDNLENLDNLDWWRDLSRR